MLSAFIWSLVIGLIVGVVVGLVVYVNFTYEIKYEKTFSIACGIIALALVMSIGLWAGVTAQRRNVEQNILGMRAVQATYTMMMEDERITGLEKFEIMRDIMNQNIAMEREKARLNQWWNKFVNQDVIEEFLSIPLVQ